MTRRFRVYIAQPKVRFYMLKGRAYAWIAFGILAMTQGWEKLLVFTFWLSVMANYLTDIGAAEATHARVAVVESQEDTPPVGS